MDLCTFASDYNWVLAVSFSEFVSGKSYFKEFQICIAVSCWPWFTNLKLLILFCLYISDHVSLPSQNKERDHCSVKSQNMLLGFQPTIVSSCCRTDVVTTQECSELTASCWAKEWRQYSTLKIWWKWVVSTILVLSSVCDISWTKPRSYFVLTTTWSTQIFEHQ